MERLEKCGLVSWSEECGMKDVEKEGRILQYYYCPDLTGEGLLLWEMVTGRLEEVSSWWEGDGREERECAVCVYV